MATICEAITPPPLPRLSTTTGCPQALEKCAAIGRATASVPPPGGYGVTRRTGFNGKTETIATTTTKTENGRTTTGTITNENGKTATLATTASHGDGQASKTTTVTGPNGKTTEREVSTTRNGDGTGTRVIEVTKPDGTKETRTETFTITPPSAP